MNLPTLQQLGEDLQWLLVLDDAVAWRRARLVHEALSWLQIPGFQLLPRGELQGVRMLQYHFGPTDFAMENARQEGSRNAQQMSGDGLDRESLLYFSRVCSIGRECLPHLWLKSGSMRGALRSSRQHLDSLNEVWWLGRWKGLEPASVAREKKLVAGADTSVDWSFSLKDGWTINMEVKNGTRSNAGLAGKQAWVFEQRENGQLRPKDHARKFCPSGPTEINVLVVTWAVDITPELLAGTQAELDDVDRAAVIDAVVLWVQGSSVDRGGWQILHPSAHASPEKRAALSKLLVEPSGEDRLPRMKVRRRRRTDGDQEMAASAIALVAQLAALAAGRQPTGPRIFDYLADDVREVRGAGQSAGELALFDVFLKATSGELLRPWEFWSPQRQAWLPLAGILFDLYPLDLEAMRSVGTTTVRIQGSPPDDCPACTALVGIHPIDNVPALPPSECTCLPWSRLVVFPRDWREGPL